MDFDDTELYRDLTDAAHDTPTWVQHTVGIWTEAAILFFAALFAAAWWRGRRGTTHAFAIAALAPLATAAAYLCSEVLKSGVTEEPPCRAVSGAVPSLADCPPSGDWSFPSNHATIAGATAVTLALVRRTDLRRTAPPGESHPWRRGGPRCRSTVRSGRRRPGVRRSPGSSGSASPSAGRARVRRRRPGRCAPAGRARPPRPCPFHPPDATSGRGPPLPPIVRLFGTPSSGRVARRGGGTPGAPSPHGRIGRS